MLVWSVGAARKASRSVHDTVRVQRNSDQYSRHCFHSRWRQLWQIPLMVECQTPVICEQSTRYMHLISCHVCPVFGHDPARKHSDGWHLDCSSWHGDGALTTYSFCFFYRNHTACTAVPCDWAYVSGWQFGHFHDELCGKCTVCDRPEIVFCDEFDALLCCGGCSMLH